MAWRGATYDAKRVPTFLSLHEEDNLSLAVLVGEARKDLVRVDEAVRDRVAHLEGGLDDLELVGGNDVVDGLAELTSASEGVRVSVPRACPAWPGLPVGVRIGGS